MGFDTTIIINNDYLADIEKDTKFGAMIRQAVLDLGFTAGDPVSLGYGAYAIETHHQDGIVVVAVGGRKGLVLGGAPLTDNKVDILRNVALQLGCVVLTEAEHKDLNAAPTTKELEEWAEMRGYKLVKKPKPIGDDFDDDLLPETKTPPKKALALVPPSGLPPLEDVKEWAKAHGWRCVVLRRKEKGNITKKSKRKGA